jgi:serine/threonine protein kinase
MPNNNDILNTQTIHGLIPAMEIGPFLPASKELQPDLKTKRYLLEKKIGAGSFGDVWLALDRVTGLKIALKFLPTKICCSKEYIVDFKENYLKVEHLHHPNIIQLKALEYDDSPFIKYFLVMEYFDGIDLKTWSKRNRLENIEISLKSIYKILLALASALDYAHSENIIHRDIKPENVMITEDFSKIKLLDFGLAAKLKEIDVVDTCGTIIYMSPEQWLGKYQSPQSDQYSFACLIYEILQGKPPFHNDNTSALREAVLNDVPIDIGGLSKAEMNVLKKALSKNSKDRFETCELFINSLVSASLPSRSSNLNKKKDMKHLNNLEEEFSDSNVLFVSSKKIAQEIKKSSKDHEHLIDSNSQIKTKIINLDNDVSLEMIWVDGGEFIMGNSNGRENEKPTHNVSVDGYWIGKYPVTQAQWHQILRTNPWQGFVKNQDDIAVCLVSWLGSNIFIKKLNDYIQTKTSESNILFRLPTEAEWEFSARCKNILGEKTYKNNYSGSSNLSEVGWYKSNSVIGGMNYPRPVGKKKPNELGIYDMTGNVWEWCEDYYSKMFYDECKKNNIFMNPVKKSQLKNKDRNLFNIKKTLRVSRGGSWHCDKIECRVTYRNYDYADSRFTDVGFRLAANII